MTWVQITTITVPGARLATGRPQFYHCIIFHSTCTVKWAREVCQCVCNEVPFASHPWQSTHHKSSLALDLLGNICMATHNPCVTCQPSVMERFPYIHMRNTLRLMIHEMAPDTRRNHSWKLIELGVNKWFYFVAIRFSVDTKSYRVPYFIFLQSIILGSTTIFINFIGVASVSFESNKDLSCLYHCFHPYFSV